MTDRYCPTCSKWRVEQVFRLTAGGKRARDCMECEAVREARRKAGVTDNQFVDAQALREREKLKQFPGVDIDRIHYKLGKVKT